MIMIMKGFISRDRFKRTSEHTIFITYLCIAHTEQAFYEVQTRDC